MDHSALWVQPLLTILTAFENVLLDERGCPIRPPRPRQPSNYLSPDPTGTGSPAWSSGVVVGGSSHSFSHSGGTIRPSRLHVATPAFGELLIDGPATTSPPLPLGSPLESRSTTGHKRKPSFDPWGDRDLKSAKLSQALSTRLARALSVSRDDGPHGRGPTISTQKRGITTSSSMEPTSTSSHGNPSLSEPVNHGRLEHPMDQPSQPHSHDHDNSSPGEGNTAMQCSPEHRPRSSGHFAMPNELNHNPIPTHQLTPGPIKPIAKLRSTSMAKLASRPKSTTAAKQPSMSPEHHFGRLGLDDDGFHYPTRYQLDWDVNATHTVSHATLIDQLIPPIFSQAVKQMDGPLGLGGGRENNEQASPQALEHWIQTRAHQNQTSPAEFRATYNDKLQQLQSYLATLTQRSGRVDYLAMKQALTHIHAIGEWLTMHQFQFLSQTLPWLPTQFNHLLSAAKYLHAVDDMQLTIQTSPSLALDQLGTNQVSLATFLDQKQRLYGEVLAQNALEWRAVGFPVDETLLGLAQQWLLDLMAVFVGQFRRVLVLWNSSSAGLTYGRLQQGGLGTALPGELGLLDHSAPGGLSPKELMKALARAIRTTHQYVEFAGRPYPLLTRHCNALVIEYARWCLSQATKAAGGREDRQGGKGGGSSSSSTHYGRLGGRFGTPAQQSIAKPPRRRLMSAAPTIMFHYEQLIGLLANLKIIRDGELLTRPSTPTITEPNGGGTMGDPMDSTHHHHDQPPHPTPVGLGTTTGASAAASNAGRGLYQLPNGPIQPTLSAALSPYVTPTISPSPSAASSTSSTLSNAPPGVVHPGGLSRLLLTSSSSPATTMGVGFDDDLSLVSDHNPELVAVIVEISLGLADLLASQKSQQAGFATGWSTPTGALCILTEFCLRWIGKIADFCGLRASVKQRLKLLYDSLHGLESMVQS
ncbi:hypothetical protein H4R33_003298 [Dimargaris cristalligena]|nr:hypothetical protein H4R33_003298 [Dimargaris cristalligena]